MAIALTKQHLSNVITAEDGIGCCERRVEGVSYLPEGRVLPAVHYTSRTSPPSERRSALHDVQVASTKARGGDQGSVRGRGRRGSGRGSARDPALTLRVVSAISTLCNEAQLELVPPTSSSSTASTQSHPQHSSNNTHAPPQVRFVGEPTDAALKVLAEKLRGALRGAADEVVDDGVWTQSRLTATQDVFQRQLQVLALCEFDRVRKSMSVLVRPVDPEGRALVRRLKRLQREATERELARGRGGDVRRSRTTDRPHEPSTRKQTSQRTSTKTHASSKDVRDAQGGHVQDQRAARAAQRQVEHQVRDMICIGGMGIRISRLSTIGIGDLIWIGRRTSMAIAMAIAIAVAIAVAMVICCLMCVCIGVVQRYFCCYIRCYNRHLALML